MLLKHFCHVKGQIPARTGIKAGGVGIRAIPAADVDDIHHALRLGKLCEADRVLQSVSALVLVSAELDLHQEIVAAGLLDGGAYLQGQTAAVLQTAAIFVGAVVGGGGKRAGENGGAVGHIDIAHVKA